MLQRAVPLCTVGLSTILACAPASGVSTGTIPEWPLCFALTWDRAPVLPLDTTDLPHQLVLDSTPGGFGFRHGPKGPLYRAILLDAHGLPTGTTGFWSRQDTSYFVHMMGYPRWGFMASGTKLSLEGRASGREWGSEDAQLSDSLTVTVVYTAVVTGERARCMQPDKDAA